VTFLFLCKSYPKRICFAIESSPILAEKMAPQMANIRHGRILDAKPAAAGTPFVKGAIKGIRPGIKILLPRQRETP